MIIKGTLFAEACGVTKQAISRLTRKGILVQNQHGLYNLSTKKNKEYLIKHGVTLKKVKELDSKKRQQGDDKQLEEKKDNKESKVTKTTKTTMSKSHVMDVTGLAEKYLSMTVMELIGKHGDLPNLKDWAGILKTMVTTQRESLKVREHANELVEKDFVVSNLRKYIDSFVSNYIDFIEGSVDVIIGYVESDPDSARAEIMQLLTGGITTSSRNTKKAITMELKKIKQKDNDEEDYDS